MIQHNLKFPRAFTSNGQVKRIVLHHVAGNMTVEEIHDYHCRLGWNGIAYHYYVDKDGSVHVGRPVWAQGAGCEGMNAGSVHVVFNGNMDTEPLTSAALKAGLALICELLDMFLDPDVLGHKDVNATDCPGRLFPLDTFKRVAAGRKVYSDLTLYLSSLPTDAWAEPSSRRGIRSGVFKDGDGDSLVDRPRTFMSRQELAVVLDRLGLLGGETKLNEAHREEMGEMRKAIENNTAAMTRLIDRLGGDNDGKS